MRQSKEETLRLEGAHWAFDRIEKYGYENALREFRNRGAMMCPLGLKQSELDKFQDSAKRVLTKGICSVTILALHDAFGMSKEDIQKFIDMFNVKTEYIDNDWDSWGSQAKLVQDLYGINIDPNEELPEEGTEACEVIDNG